MVAVSGVPGNHALTCAPRIARSPKSATNVCGSYAIARPSRSGVAPTLGATAAHSALRDERKRRGRPLVNRPRRNGPALLLEQGSALVQDVAACLGHSDEKDETEQRRRPSTGSSSKKKRKKKENDVLRAPSRI